jgi:hypothetical protein
LNLNLDRELPTTRARQRSWCSIFLPLSPLLSARPCLLG